MPLLWLGLCVIAGILVSAHYQFTWQLWAIPFFAGILLSIPEFYLSKKFAHPLLSRKIFAVPISLLLSAFALGGLRFQSVRPNPNIDDVAYYQPSESVSLVGTIISFPELSSISSTAIIEAELLSTQGIQRPVSGKVEMRLPAGFHLAYGERLLLSGPLKTTLGKGEPFYASYLARREINTRMPYPQIQTLGYGYGNPFVAFLYQLRNEAHDFLESQMPVRESALLSGILLGIDWGIPGYLEGAYRATGTVHIIAISGFNIALVTGLIIRLFRRFFKPLLAGFLALSAILFYTMLVGAEPSVVRAAIMGSLSLPAFYLGRRIIGLNSLTIAAAVMALLNPLVIWDLGFQLSFLATLGLMVLADPMINKAQEWVENRLSERASQTALPFIVLIISTLCAQLAVSPVVLELHPYLQPYSLAANLLILPLQPPLMALGGASVLLYFLMPSAGALLARLAWLLAAFCNQVALHFSKLHFAELALPQYSSKIALVLVLSVMVFATISNIRGLSRPLHPDEQG